MLPCINLLSSLLRLNEIDCWQRWALPQIGRKSANLQIADSSFYLRICEPNFHRKAIGSVA